MTNIELTLSIYGVICVVVTAGWRTLLDRMERATALRAQCEQLGHDWADPIQVADIGTYASCRRCHRQRHRRYDGSWTE
jgi:hypothetical protein